MTEANFAVVVDERMPEEPEGSDVSFGTIDGAVYAIFLQPLRLTVLDTLFDCLVTCFLPPELYEQAREAWGKRVAITGLIYRDPDTGQPMEVRQVGKIEIEEESPARYSFRRIRGIIPWRPDHERPEVIIRRGRDAT